MGEPKALLRWGRRSLLEHTLATARAAGATPLVVLGADGEQLRAALPPGVLCVENPRWREGMGTSIASGAQHLIATAWGAPVGVVAIDQPLIDAAHLAHLFDRCTAEVDAVATRYGTTRGTLGIPAVFNACLLPCLAALTGDQGARALLRQPDAALHIAAVDCAATQDLDTPAQWQAFLSRYAAPSD